MQYIEINQAKRFGKPCIIGTRITVTDSLEMLASGMTQADILEEPQIFYLNRSLLRYFTLSNSCLGLPDVITLRKPFTRVGRAYEYTNISLDVYRLPIKADWFFYKSQ